MSQFDEFKAFLAQGNAVDLATGVIIGGAFGKIVNSLVNDIIMPPIGLLIGGVDFKSLFVTLGAHQYATLEEAVKAGAPVIRYGIFLNTVLEFLIIAAAIFFVVKQMARMATGALVNKQVALPAAKPKAATTPKPKAGVRKRSKR
jgi:large conductance mechanosensitive channel